MTGRNPNGVDAFASGPDLPGKNPPTVTARYLPLALLLAPALAFARPAERALELPDPVGGPLAVADLAAIPSVYALGDDGPQDGPRRFTLGPASPNPFSSTTRLTLTVDATQRLTVAVFDALGRRVALLHDGAVSAGAYPMTFDAGALPAGLYVVRVTDGLGGTATRAIALSR
jgi:hypothetical protein